MTCREKHKMDVGYVGMGMNLAPHRIMEKTNLKRAKDRATSGC